MIISIYINTLLIHVVFVTEIERFFPMCMNSQVCEGITGHTEAVKVIYDKRSIPYKFLCDIFWESHDPTNKDYLVIISIFLL